MAGRSADSSPREDNLRGRPRPPRIESLRAGSASIENLSASMEERGKVHQSSSAVSSSVDSIKDYEGHILPIKLMCQEVIDGQLRLSAWMSRVEQKLNHALESLMPGSPGTEMAACKRHSLNTINSRRSSSSPTPSAQGFSEIETILGGKIMKAKHNWRKSRSNKTREFGKVSPSAPSEPQKPVAEPAKPKPAELAPAAPSEPAPERVTLPHATSNLDGLQLDGELNQFGRQVSVAASRRDEFSLTELFRQRESQLIPAPGGSPTVPTLSKAVFSEFVEDEEVREACAISCCLALSEACTRLCGLAPLVQSREETEEGEEVRPWALATSKAYHCAVLLLAVVVCTDAILGLSSWQHVDLDVEVSWRSRTYTLFTDAAAGLGTLAVLSSYGGLRNYFTTASAQFELTDYLTRYMEHAGLKYRWRQQRARDVASAFLLWSTSVGAYLWFHEGRFTSLAYTRLFGYAFRLACLLSACVLQISKWRGITLMIVAFAQALSGGRLSCREARGHWRELISCMRQTSRMHQFTSASLGSLIVLIAFGTLFDMQQGRLSEAMPNLCLAIALFGVLFVAASATAHCTRLPSLVSMLGGNDMQEEEYDSLALFLTLSESGFFMWDTRVTLGVIQKFVYFTMAIVGTIGFQLGVLQL
ncbi:unnamed protein product [Effrenium voratum]|uniref:Uncharacterized protein n=1 Tax=Effrenium voratum TaxID=2562239 RepID=A0AA36JM74_9DINO|nr:unnamed protein product [Effrenium voratum]CAJ1408090.1 unnamed protein product [Effrenium voratum]|mmetsp:Transcript_114188/g.271809  ORF Transcript_114188/g.271809 Transcript_114188/m.271809 type:complete len:646 (+) Transcript_114188:39-1976(+)